jgi:Fe-S-cluster containining protein
MNVKRWLREVYAEIPDLTGCPPGCVECCGPIVWTRAEWRRVPADAKRRAFGGDVPGDPPAAVHGLGCRFAVKGVGCSIYDRRPLLCRMMAVAERLRCPKLPGAPMMEPSRSAEIGAKYAALVKEGR